jgi:hypothetical protein
VSSRIRYRRGTSGRSRSSSRSTASA